MHYLTNRRGIIVEGQHDAIVYDSLLRKMGFIPKIRIARGNQRMIRKIHVYVEMLRDKNYNKIVALKDLNSRTIDELYDECSDFPSDVSLCIAKKTMEAWLLSDEEALRTQFKNPRVSTFNHPEELDDPKSTLRRLYLENGKKYVAKRALPKIINHMNIQKIRDKCPSFSEFETALHSF